MLFTVYKVIAYYSSFALFGAMGLVVSTCCRLSAPFGGGVRRERFVQRAIQRELAAFVRWLGVLRLVRVTYRNFDGRPTGGRVIVANHPGLLDAVFLLARVPSAICIFKPSIRRNPVLGQAAVAAGYLSAEEPIKLVRTAAAKIAAGATLVVFPEGTRTPAGGKPGPFRPGFALIARRASAPIQLVHIGSRSDFLTKERSCWKLPQLPADIVIEAGPCLDSRSAPSTAALVARTEAWFRTPPSRATRQNEISLASAPSVPPLAVS